MRHVRIALGLFVLLAVPAMGMPIELVVNGEFEPPPTGFWIGSDSAVAGWSSSVGRMEIFRQGFAGSPSVGADGLPTGQHCEITVNHDYEIVSQVVTIPPENVFADFSFEMWPRSGNGVDFSIVGASSGAILSDSLLWSGSKNKWFAYSANTLPVLPGEDVTLQFKSIGGGGAGAHIDSVSFATYTPEPSTLALSVVGFLALLRRRRRR